MIENEKRIEKTSNADNKNRKQSSYNHLLSAGKRLMGIIEKFRNSTNKDMAKFASQINSLCDKWDR